MHKYKVRIQNQQAIEKYRFEYTWEQTRQLWYIFLKANFDKAGSVKPQDLIELSYDKEISERVKPVEDPLERVKRRYGATLNGSEQHISKDGRHPDGTERTVQ